MEATMKIGFLIPAVLLFSIDCAATDFPTTMNVPSHSLLEYRGVDTLRWIGDSVTLDWDGESLLVDGMPYPIRLKKKLSEDFLYRQYGQVPRFVELVGQGLTPNEAIELYGAETDALFADATTDSLVEFLRRSELVESVSSLQWNSPHQLTLLVKKKGLRENRFNIDILRFPNTFTYEDAKALVATMKRVFGSEKPQLIILQGGGQQYIGPKEAREYISKLRR
jgi:hypothetical protein